MVRAFVLLAIAMLTAQQAAAQRKLFLTATYDFNGAISPSQYLQQGHVLSDNFWPQGGKPSNVNEAAFDYHAGLHYRVSYHVGVESGFHYSEYDFGVHDGNYQVRNGIASVPDIDPSSHQGLFSDRGSFYAFQHYSGQYLSVYYFAGPAYICVGADNSHFPGSINTAHSLYVSPSGERLQMDVQYTKKFVSPFVEFLWGGYLGNVLFTSYMKFYMAGNIFTADYVDTQNGTTISSDHVTQNGSRIALGLRLGIGTKSHGSSDRPHSSFSRKRILKSPKFKKHKSPRRIKPKPGKKKKQTPVRDPDSVRERRSM